VPYLAPPFGSVIALAASHPRHYLAKLDPCFEEFPNPQRFVLLLTQAPNVAFIPSFGIE